jgi:hypothetical protein
MSAHSNSYLGEESFALSSQLLCDASRGQAASIQGADHVDNGIQLPGQAGQLAAHAIGLQDCRGEAQALCAVVHRHLHSHPRRRRQDNGSGYWHERLQRHVMQSRCERPLNNGHVHSAMRSSDVQRCTSLHAYIPSNNASHAQVRPRCVLASMSLALAVRTTSFSTS